jgi:hypothetical protein
MIHDWCTTGDFDNDMYVEHMLVQVHIHRGRESEDQLRASAQNHSSISARTELFAVVVDFIFRFDALKFPQLVEE